MRPRARHLTVIAAVAAVGAVGAAAAAAGAGWTIQPVSAPAEGGLAAVSCPSADLCLAVGSRGSSPPQGTLAERWSAASWAVQRTPGAGRHSSGLSHLSCPSATFCLAVGSGATGGRMTAARWDGRRWSAVAPPRLPNACGEGVTCGILGVTCPAINECMAVGSDERSGSDRPLAERWDGRRWRVDPVPGPTPYFTLLAGVSCTSPATCTAVGTSFIDRAGQHSRSLAERWDGSRWTIQPTPNVPGRVANDLQAVACPVSNDCIAVGENEIGQGLIERWDGRRWTILPTPPSGKEQVHLSAVSCPSSTACTAVGYRRGLFTEPQPLAERWDGSRWTIQATPMPTDATAGVLSGLSCATPGACMAVGQWFTGTGRSSRSHALAERWTDA